MRRVRGTKRPGMRCLPKLLDSRGVQGLISQSCHTAQRLLTVHTARPEGQVSAIVPAAIPWRVSANKVSVPWVLLAEVQFTSVHEKAHTHSNLSLKKKKKIPNVAFEIAPMLV